MLNGKRVSTGQYIALSLIAVFNALSVAPFLVLFSLPFHLATFLQSSNIALLGDLNQFIPKEFLFINLAKYFIVLVLWLIAGAGLLMLREWGRIMTLFMLSISSLLILWVFNIFGIFFLFYPALVAFFLTRPGLIGSFK